MKPALLSAARSGLGLLNGLIWLVLGIFLGPSFMGTALYALAVSAVATTVAGAGLETVVFYYARSRTYRATTMLACRVIASVFATLATALFVVVTFKEQDAYFAVISGLLCVGGLATFVEARNTGVEGPGHTARMALYSLPIALLVRFAVAVLTANVELTLLTVVAHEIFRIALYFRRRHYFSKFSFRRLSDFGYVKRVVLLGWHFYRVSLLGAMFQKFLPAYTTLFLGAASAGIAAAHIAVFDVYSTFCATFSQFIYSEGRVSKSMRSFESALRPLAILTWLLVVAGVLVLLLFAKPFQVGKILLEPHLLAVSSTNILVYGFGALFVHWKVVRGEQEVLPKYHLMALIGLIGFALLLRPFELVGIVLARSLASIFGHAAMGFIYKRQASQWRVLWKCMIWPFWLAK